MFNTLKRLRLLWLFAAVVAFSGAASAQVDFSGQSSTIPFKIVTNIPGTCKPGEFYINTASPTTLQQCNPAVPNTWIPYSPAITAINAPGIANGTYCLQVVSNSIALVSCPSGGGLSWASLTNAQWTGMTNTQWTGLSN